MKKYLSTLFFFFAFICCQTNNNSKTTTTDTIHINHIQNDTSSTCQSNITNREIDLWDTIDHEQQSSHFLYQDESTIEYSNKNELFSIQFTGPKISRKELNDSVQTDIKSLIHYWNELYDIADLIDINNECTTITYLKNLENALSSEKVLINEGIELLYKVNKIYEDDNLITYFFYSEASYSPQTHVFTRGITYQKKTGRRMSWKMFERDEKLRQLLVSSLNNYFKEKEEDQNISTASFPFHAPYYQDGRIHFQYSQYEIGGAYVYGFPNISFSMDSISPFLTNEGIIFL